MNKLLLLLALLISIAGFSQDFERNWNAVYSYEYDGNLKSASKEVDKIYRKAKKSKNETEIIKAFIYQSKFLQILEEDAQFKIVSNLQTEIKTQKGVISKALFNYIYGKILNNYSRSNRYKWIKRTNTDTIYNSDFRTWSYNDFIKQANKALDESIKDSQILLDTPLKNLEKLITFGISEDYSNTSLYDFLSSNYINSYFGYTDSFEDYKFLKQNIKLVYGDSKSFQNMNLESIRGTKMHKNLSIYQTLEKDYSTKNNDVALAQTILRRIKMIEQNTSNERDYVSALEEFSTIFRNSGRTEFQMETATAYNRLATEDVQNTDYKIKALALADSVIVSNKEPLKTQASLLKNNILLKSIAIETQKNVIPNHPNRALVVFKNIDTIYSALYRIPNKLVFKNDESEYTSKKKHDYIDSVYIDFANKNKPSIIFENILPNKRDYLQHATEIVFPALETGTYLMLTTISKDSLSEEVAYAYNVITATELSVSYSKLPDALKFQVLNRKNGKPIENATITIEDTILKTNSKGYAWAYKMVDNNNLQIQVIRDKDTVNESFSNYRYYNNHKKQNFTAKADIFTDRAIYRPGQNVFFKGILTQLREGKISVVPDTYVRIMVENANGEEIYDSRLKTNEYGSINNQFTIPKNSLTGNFRIFAEEDYSVLDEKQNSDIKVQPFWDEIDDFNSTTAYFAVEEYKRPKFEIVFHPISDGLLIGQQIKVKGKAVALTGGAISNAKINYAINRRTHKSSNNDFDYYSEDEDKFSYNKSLTSDKDGNFEIEFTANTSNLISNDEKLIFNYNINVEITDINGETIKNDIEIKVGNYNLVLGAKIKNVVEGSKEQIISLISTNLNGQFIPAIGEIKIYKVKAPERVMGLRNWKAPDIQTIQEQDFIKLFPTEPYSDENEIEKWENKKLIFSKNVNTEKDKEITLHNLEELESGQYKLYFKAKDKFGKESETIEYFKIHNKAEKNTSDKQLFNLDIINSNPKKDGFIEMKLSSAVPKLFINAEIFHESKSFFNDVIELGKVAKIIRVPIDKNWTNDLQIEIDFVWENHNFDMESRIELPIEKKQLYIETNSFRNKIEPGSNENWSFSVQEKEEKGVQAEILASMYDASLDQFILQNWKSNLDFTNKTHNYINGKRYLNFGNARNEFKNLNKKRLSFNIHQINNELNWFGFDFVNPEKNQLKYKKYLNEKVVQHSGQYITGIVSDMTGPLPGASITIVGTTRGTQTDIDGKYEIKALFGETLQVSYIGYSNFIAEISDNTINVVLEEGVNIGEVIVSGALGIKRKANAVTSSYSIIEPQNLEKELSVQIAGISINEYTNRIVFTGSRSTQPGDKPLVVIDGVISSIENLEKIDLVTVYDITSLKGTQGAALYGADGVNGVIVVTTKQAVAELGKVQTRKNFNETAFFYPQIRTDKKGNFSFNFTSPEALTQWKLRLFAHDKKANSTYLEKLIITQKDLMVTPNLPRFLREKDTITISTKITNMTSEAKSGMAMLQLFDAVSMEAMDVKMLNANSTKSFKVDGRGNTSVSWKIYVPEGLQGVQYKIVAKAGNFSDGEENILPVLTNNMLVTESIPVWVRENSSKEYTFENLKNNTSTTLRNQQLIFEYTSNPTWLAIQALPYLMEYEHECAEQTFARYYANVLASEILNSNPKIAAVFESWKKSEKPLSKLEQNEELKSILLSETPWIVESQSDEEKKKNLAMLFDLQKMKDSQKTIFDKLMQKQKASGGFAWFDGGEESEYVTQHIISGLGHLRKLTNKKTDELDQTSKKGIDFLDQKFLDNYIQNEAKENQSKLIWKNPYKNLHYLYARSLYLDSYPMSKNLLRVATLYVEEIKKNWLQYSLYEKGLASLVLSRFDEKETAKKILESLRQTASSNEDWGMYWIENKPGWYWYQAPIETQALLIEAFAEIENDKKSVDAMKVWLLKNKQNKNWPTTKATTEAVYALLMQGNDWISVKDKTVIKIGDEKIGDEKIVTKKLSENEKEAGTGFIKLNWKTDEITKQMATVSIKNNSDVPGFGGFYWQYFEDLDKIKSSQESPMKVEKELYLKATTSEGNQLQKITAEKPLKIGDLVTVRLIISTKEDMEFVHLKDMRASCFEPIDVISDYNWKNGLGFYKSTKDMATHFFFDQIKKGTYVLEYDIRVNNLGDFSNGITTIQSMYAPEFSSHTKGIRVIVTK